MLAAYIRTDADRVEVGRGELRAQFVRQEGLWVPLWMWQGDRRMLRFENHAWLALGHVRPRARDWEILEDSADKVSMRFWGQDSYFGVPVEWSVWFGVEDPWPGFTITTEIVPAQTIELMECFTRLETPYEYDGYEEVLGMIGQNPIVHWRAGQLVTPPCYGRTPPRVALDGLACALGGTRTPLCCVRLAGAVREQDRYTTVLGHWHACCFRTICVAPTAYEDGRRAYQFLVGTLDWRCDGSFEPNVFFAGGQRYRQRLSVAFSSEMPGGTLDRWFFGAFERSLRLFFPENPVPEAARRARAKQVTLAQANAWLLEMIGGKGVPGLYGPERGIVAYTEGSCPAAGHYSPAGLAPWLAALGYQSYITRRAELGEICERLIPGIAEAVDRPPPMSWSVGPTFSALLPLLRYLTCYSSDLLQGVVRRMLGRLLEAFPPEGGERPDVDFGSEALHAEAYLLAGQLAGDKRLLQAGFHCLERVNAAARDRFWRFGCSGGWMDMAAGGQARPLGYGHAILANLIAYQRTHEAQYVEMAGTFARYLLSICFATFNDSEDPDFDTRGFANAALSGHDRMIECSPLETSDSLRCLAYWLSVQPEASVTSYDVLWLLSRTFCGVFPAARERRNGRTVQGDMVTQNSDDLPAAIAFQRFPFIAYENPVRQTWQSPRASLESLQNFLTFGGGLASCDREGLLVLAPRVGGWELAERVGRVVHIYNPTEVAEKARLAVHHLPPRREFDIIVGNKRIAASVLGDALNDIELDVPPRTAVAVEVAPSRQPSTHF